MRIPKRPLTGVVYRKLPEDLVVNTIFGTKEVSKVRCITCRKEKLKSEFYLESKSKRKYVNQVRKQCIVCWDMYGGYMGPNKDISSNTIIMFICDEVKI